MSISDTALRELRREVPEAVTLPPEGSREHRRPTRNGYHRFSRDMVSASRWHHLPDAVVLPRSVDEVVRLMRWAARHRVPVTPRGGGSGLAGGAVAAPGGVVCSLEQMTRVVHLDTPNLAVTVEPGVVTRELDAVLAEHGLFFAGYPMSEEICTVGGNVATNAGGGRAVKHGVTADHVLGLQVVTASGAVLELGGPRLKDVTGLNLLPLFIGSEGILGIITAVTLRLTPRPGARRAILAAFPSAAAATDTVTRLRQASVGVPSSIEYIDGDTARGAAAGRSRRNNGAAGITVPADAAALLLVEAEGRNSEACVADLAAYREIVAAGDGTVIVAADSDTAVEQAWALRKAVPWWVKRQSGEYHSVEDVVVPIAAIPDLVATARRTADTHGLPVAIFGHAGDGNFHVNPMKPATMSPDDWDRTLHHFLDDLYRFVVDRGGTISGEHGIGRKRVSALPVALSPPVLEAMRAVKAALDPQGILNPGVLLP